MVFAEAEATTVTDELAARSSLRARARATEDWIIGKGQGARAIEDSHPPTTVNEEEDLQFDMSLSFEIGKSAEEGSNVASEVFEEPWTNGEVRIPISIRFEAGIGESWDNGRDCCATFRVRPSRANCVIDRGQVRRQPGDSATTKRDDESSSTC